MAEYQHVLAAVGTGMEARWVLSKALAVAEAKRARLSMLHVIRRRFTKDTQPITLEVAREHPDLGLDQGAYREFTALCEGLDGQGFTSLVASGHPARMILKATRERGVDLLVMGSHTHHGIAGYLGSTPDHVVHGAECDVLVVKNRAVQGQAPQDGHRKLLVPVDFSADSSRLVEHASAWAEHQGAQVTLLHIEEHFPTDRSNETITPEDQDPADDLQRRALASMAELAQQAGLSTAGREFQLNPGAAKHAIVDNAERLGADLIVIGSHGVHGPRNLLGSTTDGVLHRAPCDVLLVRVRE